MRHQRRSLVATWMMLDAGDRPAPPLGAISKGFPHQPWLIGVLNVFPSHSIGLVLCRGERILFGAVRWLDRNGAVDSRRVRRSMSIATSGIWQDVVVIRPKPDVRQSLDFALSLPGVRIAKGSTWVAVHTTVLLCDSLRWVAKNTLAEGSHTSNRSQSRLRKVWGGALVCRRP